MHSDHNLIDQDMAKAMSPVEEEEKNSDASGSNKKPKVPHKDVFD